MKIAVTSQNRRTITEHAGRCRKFWVFTTQDGAILDKELLELPKEQSFYESDSHAPHPLDDVQIFITADMGQGLVRRLNRKGITALITQESDPEAAVLLYLKGELNAAESSPHPGDCQGHKR